MYKNIDKFSQPDFIIDHVYLEVLCEKMQLIPSNIHSPIFDREDFFKKIESVVTPEKYTLIKPKTPRLYCQAHYFNSPKSICPSCELLNINFDIKIKKNEMHEIKKKIAKRRLDF